MDLKRRVSRLEKSVIYCPRTDTLINALNQEERQAVGAFGLFLQSATAGRSDAERREILTLVIRMLQGDVPTELQGLLAQEEEKCS